MCFLFPKHLFRVAPNHHDANFRIKADLHGHRILPPHLPHLQSYPPPHPILRIPDYLLGYQN